MKVRMTAKISGLRNGEEWPEIGEIAFVPEEEAAILVNNHLATTIPYEDEEYAIDLRESEKAVPVKKGRGRPRKQF